jgi:hypothetical protein
MDIAGMGNSMQKETKGQEAAENYIMRSFILIFIGYLEFRIKGNEIATASSTKDRDTKCVQSFSFIT